MTSDGYCARCAKHFAYLAPLHGEQGGVMCCLTCVGAWHAEHGRRRNRGRVAIRAMAAFLDAGGRVADLENLKLTAIAKDVPLFIDPLGYLHGVAESSDECIELTLELLNDVLALVHPDKHPPERQELAQRVTAQLLAIKPFVFPAVRPRAKTPTLSQSRNTSLKGHGEPLKKALQYPCQTCRGSGVIAPFDYCDACRAEWRRRKSEEREAENARNRQKYASRRQRQLQRLPQQRCAQCGKLMAKRRRRHVKFCSTACRVRAHRARNTMSGGSA